MHASRTTAALAGIVAGALVLTACGSDPEQSVPAANPATVSGAGRHVQIAADIQRADYPDACKLLPATSVQSLLGSPATSDTNAGGCAWSTGRASAPGLQVSWIQLGSGASSLYGQRIGVDAKIRAVSGIGERARLYIVESSKYLNKIVRVDVLQPRAYFRVDVTLTTTSTNDLASAQQIARRVAQLVAQQVA